MNNSAFVTQYHRGMPNSRHGIGGESPFIRLNSACPFGVNVLGKEIETEEGPS